MSTQKFLVKHPKIDAIYIMSFELYKSSFVMNVFVSKETTLEKLIASSYLVHNTPLEIEFFEDGNIIDKYTFKVTGLHGYKLEYQWETKTKSTRILSLTYGR